MPEPRGGHCPPPPIFGRSVNPIPTGEGRLSSSITTGTLNVFHPVIIFTLVAGIYRWSIILADTDFFQQSVLAADFRGRLNRPSTFYQFVCSFLAPNRFRRFCGKQNWHWRINRTLSYSAKVFT